MVQALVLTLGAILYRLLYAFAGSPAEWGNFSPMAAVVLCSGAFLSRKAAFLVPVVALLVSDIILNAHYHVPLLDTRMIPGYFSFGLILLLGLWISKQQSHKTLLLFGCSILSSLIFYVLTNTIDWLVDPPFPVPVQHYPITFAGWAQALTVGHPGMQPTILFLRNTLISDLLFTALFVATQAVCRRSPGHVPESGPQQIRH
ncbi:MAG: DUF6580 family putative transport protein [Chthoniobacterales bacterium]|jgi:hypothetical protein